MTTTASERDLPVARHIGERIHALIWSQRRKQGSVAQAVGLSGSTFSKKLRGEVPITVDELMRIAGVLGVDPGDLLPRLDSNQQPSGYPSGQVADVIPIARNRLPPGKPAVALRLVHTSTTEPEQVGASGGRGGMGGGAAATGGARGLLRVE